MRKSQRIRETNIGSYKLAWHAFIPGVFEDTEESKGHEDVSIALGILHGPAILV
jgi:hypothetical protein